MIARALQCLVVILKKPALLLPILAIFLVTPSTAQAQVGTNYGFYPGFLEAGANCWSVGGGSVRCLTASDDGQSIAVFYESPYAYVMQYALPHRDLIEDYDPGIGCATFYHVNNFGGSYEFLPPGNVGEPINVPTGNMNYHHADYTTAGQNPLSFTRYYNSRGTFLGRPANEVSEPRDHSRMLSDGRQTTPRQLIDIAGVRYLDEPQALNRHADQIPVKVGAP
jgi:hypothetical protein